MAPEFALGFVLGVVRPEREGKLRAIDRLPGFQHKNAEKQQCFGRYTDRLERAVDVKTRFAEQANIE